MSEQDGLSPVERELETVLRSLAPAPARLDPVAAAFEAGRRSTQRQVWRWQSSTAALVIISVGTWFVPARRPGLGWQRDVALAPTACTTSVACPPSEQSVLMMRQAISEKGVDGLPTVKLPPATSRENGAYLIYGDES